MAVVTGSAVIRDVHINAVEEKEIRELMRMHGLSRSAYFTANAIWWSAITLAYSLLFFICGRAIGLVIFTTNAIALQVSCLYSNVPRPLLLSACKGSTVTMIST